MFARNTAAVSNACIHVFSSMHVADIQGPCKCQHPDWWFMTKHTVHQLSLTILQFATMWQQVAWWWQRFCRYLHNLTFRDWDFQCESQNSPYVRVESKISTNFVFWYVYLILMFHWLFHDNFSSFRRRAWNSSYVQVAEVSLIVSSIFCWLSEYFVHSMNSQKHLPSSSSLILWSVQRSLAVVGSCMSINRAFRVEVKWSRSLNVGWCWWNKYFVGFIGLSRKGNVVIDTDLFLDDNALKTSTKIIDRPLLYDMVCGSSNNGSKYHIRRPLDIKFIWSFEEISGTSRTVSRGTRPHDLPIDIALSARCAAGSIYVFYWNMI